jgi:hypothetical protein
MTYLALLGCDVGANSRHQPTHKAEQITSCELGRKKKMADMDIMIRRTLRTTFAFLALYASPDHQTGPICKTDEKQIQLKQPGPTTNQ